MKSKRKKKILAAILCMVMVLTNNFSILAEGTEVPNEIIQPETPEQINESETEVIPEESKEEMPESEVTPQKPETEEMPQEEATPEEPKVEEVPQEEATPEKPKTEEVPQTEETPKELKYEDEQVSVVVTAVEEGAIPTGATLKVLPITLENNETKAQYEDVEKRIQEKVAEEEKEVAGFLAYDITFVDGEGNEIEPNSKVKVSMNYKNAVLPNDVKEKGSENAEVSVLHLEEDENGNVKDVVNMSEKETTKIDTLATAEGPMVQNVETETESFSVFTITWTGRRGRPLKKLNVKFVDYESGKEITLSNATDYNISLKKDEIFDFSQITSGNADSKYSKYYHIEDHSGNKYMFCNAVNVWGDYSNQDRGSEITGLKYDSDSRTIQWRHKADEKWRKHDAQDKFYLVYLKQNINKPEDLTPVKTVDTLNSIEMRMIDYSTAADGLDEKLGGQYNGRVHQGLVKNVLKDGYPVAKGHKDNPGEASLKKLFEGGQPVNHLFLKDTFDQTGYYEYSSFENYAYLNKDGDFTVYNQIGTPSRANTSYYWKRGNFLPYSEIENGKYAAYGNLYDENGKQLSTKHPRYNEGLYLAGENQPKDEKFYFGMYLAGDFAQLKDGQVQNNVTKEPSDMIYEFNGDDDLWVFIDDVLVLDIGGEHDAHSGLINFATGYVEVNITGNEEDKQKTTIKDMFWKAGKFPDGTDWKKQNDSRVSDYFDGDTFKDYTPHTMKMFYMERGAGASNLHMKFNLEMIPDGQVQVRKKLAETTDPVKYGDVDFGFELSVENSNENGEGTGILKKVTSLEGYDATKKRDDGTEEQLEMDENGRFYLKPEETAYINNIPVNLQYEVKEVDVQSDHFDKIEISGTTIKEERPDGGSEEKIGLSSGPDTVGNRPMVTFINSCSAKNLRTLQIEKEMKGNQTSSDTFKILVEIEGSDGKLHPYKGNYFINQESKLTEDGYILLKQGEVANIYNILSDTNFKVTEVNLNEELYKKPEYQVSVDSGKNFKTGNEGTIILSENAKVIVTNSYKAIITVEKIWKPSAPANIPGVYVGLYKQNGNSLEPVADKYALLNEKENWKYTFTGLDEGSDQYVVRELKPINEGNGDFTIDRMQYVAVDEGASILLDNTDYNVNYEEQGQDGVKECKIINTASWQIVKISDSSDKITLEGAIFKLTKTPENSEFKPIWGESDGNGIVKWYVDAQRNELFTGTFDDGEYILTEVRAPSGYIQSGEKWKITIKDGIVKNILSSTEQQIAKDKSDGKDTYYFKNTPLYELPEAGGKGTFVYTIGGTLLLMAAVLLLYKMKRKEVLKG